MCEDSLASLAVLIDHMLDAYGGSVALHVQVFLEANGVSLAYARVRYLGIVEGGSRVYVEVMK